MIIRLGVLLMAVVPVVPGPSRWSEAVRVIESGVRQRVYPGGVLVIGRRDSLLFSTGVGTLTWDHRSLRPDPDETWWDLASLTKVVATSATIMTLVDRGRLELDRPVGNYLPAFHGSGRERVTVRMLLNHTSGLPSYVPFYRTAANREELLAALWRVPLERTPGLREKYSDLNAMLAGLVVESAAVAPLGQIAWQSVFQPLGMARTGFGVPDSSRAAASIVHHGRAVAGEVNDRNARVMGGVSGHAGLFATGADLARFAQAWLREGREASGQWVAASTMRQFLTRSTAGGTRLLGWDSPDFARLGRSQFGTLATPTTFGHTGWTGTFLWFDPSRDVFVVFLTNRSLGPTTRRSMEAMRSVRARLSDAIARAVRGHCVATTIVTC